MVGTPAIARDLFPLGSKVVHPAYGIGTVLSVREQLLPSQNRHVHKVTVQFDGSSDSKEVAAELAGLVRLQTPTEQQNNAHAWTIQRKDAWATLEDARRHALPHQFIMAVSVIRIPPGHIYYNILKRQKRKHCWGTQPSVEAMQRHNERYHSPPLYFVADDEYEFRMNAGRYLELISKGFSTGHLAMWTAQRPLSSVGTQ